MYHAMFSSRMVVNFVDQQQQHHNHHHNNLSDTNNNNSSSNRQNRILSSNCYSHSPFEHPYPLELLQLMGLEMPPVRNRSYNNHPGGRGGGGWRDRGNLHGSSSSLMPPPVSVGFRPLVHNSTMKRNSWNKNNGRPPRCSQRDPLASNSDLSYNSSSDSGFSSRSPTPSKQQLQQSALSDVSALQATGEESDDTKAGTSSLDCKGVKRLHEVYGTPVHNSAVENGHSHQQQHQQPYFHKHSASAQSIQTLHGLQFYRQQSWHPGLIRNESPYLSKRRYHSGRHSPPLPVPPHRHSRGGRRLNEILFPLSGGLGLPVFVAADQLLSRAYLMQVTCTPPQLISGCDWDKLSEGIWNKFMIHQQTEDTFKKKIKLWKCLSDFIKLSFPRYGLYLVGSTMNGFGSDKSDVDMCLHVRHTEMDQRNEAVGHLEQMLKCLRGCGFIEHPELIQAKVPILKFRDTCFCLEVDLNCNNSVGIRNTHLLSCYSRMDWRVRPLVLIIKLWAHKHNINDAKNMTISSYSLVLMVIHFLQCGVTPPVLPCLHGMYPGKFTPHSDIQMIDIYEDLPPFNSDNSQTLGELLHDFLRYYAEFSFSQYAMSVRLASRVPIEECRRARTYKNDPHQWKYLCIEEPFDLTNTARSVYDRDVFERIKAVFQASYISLKKTRDIESIFLLDDKD
ncbi:poly(A) RNA polymerase gld-2 homolog A-like isoform X2 [Zootermopsis nevadensis]|uniref:poly(A) RNA polymerase gld-2 homolog A-like isoform X2 n=1 Tax=Zootermopsis nevadensis TaxID=136037 RepID=UPI000B8E553E|nr:poly(A) RNA polymerase gld-2 homolog A-like isoform X2 [Zootermopsis nevadensis]